MSSSMKESLAAKLQSDPAVAALLQSLLSGGEATATAEPKALPELPPIQKDWDAGYQLIRELRSRKYDGEAVVTSAEVKGRNYNYPEGVVVRWADGTPITFGDLAYCVEGGATNANGEAVNDYPNVWSLTWPEAKGALAYLRQQPKVEQQPKAAGGKRGSGKPKASPKTAEGGLQLSDVVSLLTTLGIIPASPEAEVPAKPEPAIGHRKAAQPAKPVEASDDLVELVEDQIIAFGNDLWQVTVHANGRPAFRKTIV
jgi:hypothetical protein